MLCCVERDISFTKFYKELPHTEKNAEIRTALTIHNEHNGFGEIGMLLAVNMDKCNRERVNEQENLFSIFKAINSISLIASRRC